jgi:xanthine/uracil permease
MKTQTILRVCVVLEWVVYIIGVGLSFVLQDSLPTPLKDWLVAEAERDMAVHELVLLGGGVVVLLLAAIVASVGLLFLQRWAAWLYLFSFIVGCLLCLFYGPVVEHGVADVVGDVATFLSGLVLGLAFFTDALRTGGVRAEPITGANAG